MHSFICVSCILTRKLTLPIVPSERQRFADTNHPRIMEETKSIDRDDMVLGLFLDSMTTNFPNHVVIDEQAKDSLKKDNKPNVAANVLPHPPQEHHLLPHHRPTQSDQKLRQKQIRQKHNDQKRRRPRNDPIPMSNAHLLPIMVNVGEIVPKQIDPVRFPYSRKYDPHAICGYHVGHVGNSIENCYPFKARTQKLIGQKLLSLTPVTAKAPIEKRFEYKGPLIHVQVHPPVSSLLCNIQIKDTTLECRWPILGHHLLLLLHLSMPILGSPMSHLEFIMVRLLIN